jgi:hypothetical protein
VQYVSIIETGSAECLAIAGKWPRFSAKLSSMNHGVTTFIGIANCKVMNNLGPFNSQTTLLRAGLARFFRQFLMAVWHPVWMTS